MMNNIDEKETTIMFIKDKKEILITCPHCGAEYLPAEVYVPSAFFGKPEDIDRDRVGKLEAYDGKAMDLKETFICEYCNKEFNVVADVKFKTQKKEGDEFEEVYSTPLYPNKLSLFEGE